MVVRKWGRAAAALTAGVVAGSVGVAPAVSAAASPVADFPHLALTPEHSLETEFVAVRNPGAARTLHEVIVTVDTSQVSTFVEVEPFLDDQRCVVAPAGFTCKLGDTRVTDGYQPLISLSLRLSATAVAGQRGTLVSTVTSREFGSSVRRSTLTAAEGVSFEPGGSLERTVKPGQQVGLPLTLHNTGSRTITSMYLWFFREAMFTYPQSFSNCQYGGTRIFCRFDDDVPAGATFRLSEPLKVTVRKQVPAPESIGHSTHWATTADVQNDLESFRAEKPKAGTGGRLRLVPVTGVPAVPVGTEVPQSTGRRHFVPSQDVFMTVVGRNVADLAAVGATARGKVKKTVTVAVGAKNLGPAFVFGVRRPAAKVVVKRPKGTTVVGVPAGCVPSLDGKAIKRKDPRGAAEYLCTTTVNPFEVGQRVLWRFKIRVDRKGARNGSVRVVSSATDGKRANNTAALRINPPKKK